MSRSDAPVSLVLEWAEAAYLELFRAMARVSPTGAIEERDGLSLIATGPLLPFLNFAALTRLPDDAAAAVDRARRFYEPFGVRFMLAAPEQIGQALGPVAVSLGMEPGRSVRMLLTPLDGECAAVKGLTLRRVENAEALRLYIDTMTAGFGGEPWAAPRILSDPAFLRVPGVTHYLGHMDGQPVATAMRLTAHRIAVVANVSTMPAFRRRGIGEAITWHAALDGREEGCLAAYLQASEMGVPVYRRMGFQQVAVHRTWLSPT